LVRKKTGIMEEKTGIIIYHFSSKLELFMRDRYLIALHRYDV